MSLTRLVGCCLLAVACCSPSFAQAAPLVWKFNVGDQQHYRITQNMDTKMSLGAAGREIETTVQQVVDMTWKIEQVDNQGVATLMLTVDRLQMDIQTPGQPKLHYDTNSDAAPTGFAAMLAPLFKTMTTEPFPARITPRGEIKSLELPEGLAKVMQAIPGTAMMGEMFSDEGFKNMLQQSLLVLPDQKDLAQGYEWTNQTAIKNAQFGEMGTATTTRYLGSREVKGKLYEVFSVARQIDFGEAPAGVRIDVVSHESSGEIFFSRESGQLESSTLQQEIVLDILSADSQGVTQEMGQTMILERVKKREP